MRGRWVWALVAAQAALGLRAAWHYARWPRLCPAPGGPPTLPVAVIVPARNEAANLARLLPSLQALRPAPDAIVVVDDRSTDATAAVARSHGVHVVAGSRPPAGWVGKCWACQQGRAAVAAPWLLFTDADTTHAPASLRAALAACEASQADALSLLTEQDCHTLWERLLLPFAYAGYFAATASAGANEDGVGADARRSALANGQYLLVRAAAYDAAGGHAAVRGSLTEDVALASRLRASGARLRVLRAGGQVRVRMYAGLADVWEGFRKNSFGFLRADPRRGAIVAAATTLGGLPLGLAIAAAQGRAPWTAAGASYGVAMAAYLPWLRWFGVPAWYAPLQPLAAGVFQALALDAAARNVLGLSVTWKGRRYRP